MDMYKVNKFVGDMVFGLLLISGAGIFGISSFVAFNIFAILEKELIGALFKRIWGSEEAAVDEITATININSNSNNSSLRSINNSRNRLKLKEIISHIYWYHKIAENLQFFIRAILPVQYHPDWEEYNKGIQEHDGTIIRRTPFIFIYLLNNPSETAADFAETFTRRVLSNLGFHFLSSNNDNLNYHGGYDDRIESFEQALSKSCFTRELVKRYNCIGLDNLGVPPAETRFSDFEEKVLRRFYFKPDDDEWVEPMNNWCNWYIKTIHERIFPSHDYQLFEATVKYLFFSFLHDIAAPFKSLLALLGIKTISS